MRNGTAVHHRLEEKETAERPRHFTKATKGKEEKMNKIKRVPTTQRIIYHPRDRPLSLLFCRLPRTRPLPPQTKRTQMIMMMMMMKAMAVEVGWTALMVAMIIIVISRRKRKVTVVRVVTMNCHIEVILTGKIAGLGGVEGAPTEERAL